MEKLTKSSSSITESGKTFLNPLGKVNICVLSILIRKTINTYTKDMSRIKKKTKEICS